MFPDKGLIRFFDSAICAFAVALLAFTDRRWFNAIRRCPTCVTYFDCCEASSTSACASWSVYTLRVCVSCCRSRVSNVSRFLGLQIKSPHTITWSSLKLVFSFYLSFVRNVIRTPATTLEAFFIKEIRTPSLKHCLSTVWATNDN